MARAVLRPMLRQRSGRIINMSSVSGQMGNAGQANYSASKAGLIGLTKALAREVASRGITVNAVAPGFVVTELTDGPAGHSEGRDQGRTPLGRFATPEEIADCGHLPRVGRGRLHHGTGARGGRRPRDDVAVPFTLEPTAIPEVLIVRPRTFPDEPRLVRARSSARTASSRSACRPASSR